MRRFRMEVNKNPVTVLGSFLACATLLSSCATTHRSVVAMKISDQEAHIAMGEGEVKTGDRLHFFRHECQRPPGGVYAGLGIDPICKKVKTGEGVVTKLLRGDYAVVRVDRGVIVEEGMTVEKH